MEAESIRKLKSDVEVESIRKLTEGDILQIWWFLITVILELLRGCTGVVALYQNKVSVWANDNYFYPLDVLPDYLILCILCWPKLLAK